MSEDYKTSNGLLNCPFCGHRDIRAHYRRSLNAAKADEWVIECHSCSCELTGFATERDALAGWNNRAAPETLCGPQTIQWWVTRLKAQEAITDKLVAALGMIYDKWENGDRCYEDGDPNSSYMGNAFKLTQDEEVEILSLLPPAAELTSSKATCSHEWVNSVADPSRRCCKRCFVVEHL